MSDETILNNSVELATELTIAWLSNPNTRANAEDVPAFLEKMHTAVAALSSPATAAPEEAPAAPQYEPAVTVRKSISNPNHIISLIDGKPYKTLKRHLSGHGLTPAEYRARYGLKADYPMVSASYSTARREMAKKIGLGRKPSEKAPATAAAAPTAPKARKPRAPKTTAAA